LRKHGKQEKLEKPHKNIKKCRRNSKKNFKKNKIPFKRPKNGSKGIRSLTPNCIFN
jgi:hypothetical protein